MIDIKRQVVATRFLAGLDNDYAAAVRNTLRLQGTDRRQAAANGVAIVGAAAAIELVAAQYRQPRTKTIRSEEHTSATQPLLRIPYTVLALRHKTKTNSQ